MRGGRGRAEAWFYCHKFDTTEDVPWWRLAFPLSALSFHPACREVWALAASGVAGTTVLDRIVASAGLFFGEGFMLTFPFHVAGVCFVFLLVLVCFGFVALVQSAVR